MVRWVLVLGAGLFAAGCDTPNTRFASVTFGDSQGLAAGGNLRLVTQRTHPALVAGGTPPIVCSEPMPDYIVGFKREAEVKVQTVVADKPAELGSGKFASDESPFAGEGRTAGVLALRDGLYAACQAYANGIIGQDAYSVILSQYGLLITAVAAPEKDGAARAAKASSSFAAVLVACISAHDPSRPTRAGGNRLLDSATCRRIVQMAGSARRG